MTPIGETRPVRLRAIDWISKQASEKAVTTQHKYNMAKRAVPARHGTKHHGTMSCSCLVVPYHFGLPCQG
jgi:hypothetical protein